jgi:hypothetical protein
LGEEFLEEFLGEKFVDKKYMGEKSVNEKYLFDLFEDEKYIDKKYGRKNSDLIIYRLKKNGKRNRWDFDFYLFFLRIINYIIYGYLLYYLKMVRIFGIFNILILKYILYYNGIYFF